MRSTSKNATRQRAATLMRRLYQAHARGDRATERRIRRRLDRLTDTVPDERHLPAGVLLADESWTMTCGLHRAGVS